MTGTMVDRRTLLAAGAACGIVGAAGAALIGRDRPIGLQLFTVSDAARRHLDGTLARVAAIGYRTVELAGYHGHGPSELRAAGDRAGLRFTSIHLPAVGRDGEPGLDGDPARLAAELHLLGIGRAVLPLFVPPPAVSAPAGNADYVDFMRRAGAAMTRDDWRRNADLLNRTARALQPFGVALAYHNHNPELRPLPGGGTGLDLLLAGTDPALVSFEMDAGWVAAAGADPAALLARHPRRFTAMHVKDNRANVAPNFDFRQEACPVGQGRIDWRRLLPAARRAGVRDFFVEQDPPFATDPFQALAESFAFLSAGRRTAGTRS